MSLSAQSLKRGDTMTFDELKKEAKQQGYNLIKIKPREKFLPCTCGAKRHQWHSYVDGRSAACKKCGKESPIVPKSSTDNEVISAWNRMIEEERR